MEWLNWRKEKPFVSARQMAHGAEWLSKFVRGISKNLKIAGLGLVFAFAAQASVAKCADDVVDLRWDGGSARFSVEIADSAQERSQGLMFRESLARYGGMLFIYNRPHEATFWMKNTLIPLDMIFLDEQGVVVHVHENAIPGDLSGISGGNKTLAVLEVNGGLSRKLGLTVGAQMRHPAFSENSPLWPCE